MTSEFQGTGRLVVGGEQCSRCGLSGVNIVTMCQRDDCLYKPASQPAPVQGEWQRVATHRGMRWLTPEGTEITSDELLPRLNALQQRLAEAERERDLAKGAEDAAVWRLAQRDGELEALRAALEAALEKFQRIQNVALPSSMVMARAVDGEQEACAALQQPAEDV